MKNQRIKFVLALFGFIYLNPTNAFALRIKREEGVTSWRSRFAFPELVIFASDEITMDYQLIKSELKLQELQKQLKKVKKKKSERNEKQEILGKIASHENIFNQRARPEADRVCQFVGHPQGAATFTTKRVSGSMNAERIYPDGTQIREGKYRMVKGTMVTHGAGYKKWNKSSYQVKHFVFDEITCKGTYTPDEDRLLTPVDKLGALEMKIKQTLGHEGSYGHPSTSEVGRKFLPEHQGKGSFGGWKSHSNWAD